MTELADLEVLVVDCQTTGATPALGAVLQIGWGVLRPSQPELEQPQAHWVALPEGHVVSRQVRRLTGFDERQLTGVLEPVVVWQRLRASMHGQVMPTAIHFARFELGFLRDWAGRFQPEAPFPFDAVCLHAAACRLYPELPRRSIRALAGHLGHGLDLTRRSLGHVEATAFIWRRLVAELGQRGVRTWAELAEWLALPVPPSPRSRKRSYPLPSSRYRSLPDAPGVYRFMRANGDVLYVGKAASLRKRVMSHFAAASTREHTLEMLTQVSDIQVTLTPTALEAAVLENESIKSLQPPYNLQLTAYEQPAWFSTSRFDAAATTAADPHRIGPLPHELSLRALGAQIALTSGQVETRSLRARAVGAAERWAPDERVFAAGFAAFAERHLRRSGTSTASARQAVLRAAKVLVSVARLGASAEEELGPDEVEPAPSAPAVWDPERVTRHLERALAQAYQVLRRTPWLILLHDSAIVYREPGSDQARLLVLRNGDLAEARDVEAGEPIVPPSPRANLRRAPLSFDRAKYDRLRVFSSELKRVQRDHGSVAVYVAPGRRLGQRILQSIFEWI